MRNLTSLLLAGMFSGAVMAGDLPSLPPPPPLPAASNTPASAAADLSLPPALGADNASLPALPPAPAQKPVSPAPAASKTAPAAADLADLPPLPTAPAPAASVAPAPAAAPMDNANSGLDAVAPAEGGTSGVITGGRVNIRAGDSTKYEIVYTADPETPVTVYEKKGEWVKIGFPEKEFCYIEQRVIEGTVPTDFSEQGVARAIQAANVKVYVRPWAGSTVVGSLKQGENVVITGARGQFLRIRPPATAYAWVFEKFIRYNAAGVQTVELTPEEKAAKEKEKEVALRQKIDQAKGIRGKLPGSKELNPLMVKLHERTEMERKQRESQRAAAKSLVDNLDKQMAAIDAETAERIADIEKNRVDMRRMNEEAMRAAEENYRPGPPPGSMGNAATGWIEHVAFWRSRPAEFRLVKGQEIICYIRSTRYNLADYNGRRVVVSGNLEKARNGNLDIMVVDSLRLFDQSQVEMPLSSPRTETVPVVTPAPVVQAAPESPRVTYSELSTDDRTSVKVIKEKTFAPVYRDSAPRTIYRDEQVVTLRDNPTPPLNQNDNIVIIEDTPGTGSNLRVGERVDVTGLPTPQ